MKPPKQLAAVAVFCISTLQMVAIEGLKPTIQGDDVILGWPSTSNETYIVQYRATLETNDVWQTLTNSYPAFEATNWTSFVHSNAVCEPAIAEFSGGGSGELPAPKSNTSSTTSGSSGPPMPPMPGGYPISETDSSGDVISSDGSGGNGAATFSSCSSFYRVVREGVYLAGITNEQTVSGIIRISGTMEEHLCVLWLELPSRK